ncbi:MAG: peroxisome- protein [Peltula sp. TS41687]|nr:MAG: peroxisome- protein [Peltula sp. TS41687]
MSSHPQYSPNTGRSNPSHDGNPPTVAVFTPQSLSHAAAARRRSTILVQQKSPLLATTPPQVTRALAYSHPFLLPLNKIVGLISWTTDDPWESFLLLAAFWAVLLYGDAVVRWAGPLLLSVVLLLGIYVRRFSPPLSPKSDKSNKGKNKEAVDEGRSEHQKTFDEIVDTLQVFTTRCDMLLDPILSFTEFLSTQHPGRSVMVRLPLIRLLLRLTLVTPIWILLALPPVRLITTKRIVLTSGSLVLSWHSRPARVTRAILWRSRTIRRLCSVITGLDLEQPADVAEPHSPKVQSESRTSTFSNLGGIGVPPKVKRKSESTGVRFTFTLWENQRRWLGLGWTNNLFAYERAPWTDEHLNPAPSKDELELPEVEGGDSEWKWVEGSEWRVDGAGEGTEGGKKSPQSDKRRSKNNDAGGWIYYDSKWRDGRRQDGWGRYTRRRKWYRDAELFELGPTENTESASTSTVKPSITPETATTFEQNKGSAPNKDRDREVVIADDTVSSTSRKSRWFHHRNGRSNLSGSQHDGIGDEEEEEEDHNSAVRTHQRVSEHGGWGVADDAKMGLG